MMKLSPLLLSSVVICGLAASASAHAVLDVKEATAGAAYKGVVGVGHGCKGSTTTKVRVTIPDGLIAVKPVPKAGWTVSVTKAAYAQPVEFFHGKLTEGVKEIVWDGGKLPNDFYDEFQFRAYVNKDVAVGTQLYVPVVQECEQGVLNWVQIPRPGQSASDLKEPAPFVRVAQAAPATKMDGGMAPAALMAGKIRIEQPWTRATPGGAKVAGGFLRLTNTGTEVDRLIGGSAEIAGRFEIHEMKTEDGIMKMRQLAQGLEIKPGETVELKPGSYHVMFMDLKQGVKDGDTIKGTLVFEKGGTVNVEFVASPVGSPAAPAAAPMGGHGGHGGMKH